MKIRSFKPHPITMIYRPIENIILTPSLTIPRGALVPWGKVIRSEGDTGEAQGTGVKAGAS